VTAVIRLNIDEQMSGEGWKNCRTGMISVIISGKTKVYGYVLRLFILLINFYQRHHNNN